MNRRTFFYHSGVLCSSLGLRALGGSATLGAFSFLGAQEFSAPKIGYLPITDHLLIIAKELQDANFTPIKFSSWADLSEALRAGAIDGAFILTPLALKLKSQGAKIKALLATHRNGSALVVKKGLLQEGQAHNPSLLKGRKIAIPSRFSTHYLLLCKLLEQADVDISELKLIDMPPPEMLQALNAGSIDGYIVAEPFCIAAQARALADIFILSKDIAPNHICCALVFGEGYLQAKKGSVLSLVRDFSQTARFITQNHQKAAELSRKFLGQKPELITKLLGEQKRVIYENLALNKEDITQVLKDSKHFGVGDFSVSYEDFVDSSFLQALALVSEYKALM